MMSWVSWIAWIALATNIGLVIYNYILCRRWRQLCVTLQSIVIRAWCNQHLPIWVPWCIANRVKFRMEMEELPPIRHKRDNWGR